MTGSQVQLLGTLAPSGKYMHVFISHKREEDINFQNSKFSELYSH